MKKIEVINDIKFTIDTEKLNFVDGLAVFEEEIVFLGDKEKFLYRGLLNKELEFVIEPKQYYLNIEIFSNNNALVETRYANEGASWVSTRHFKLNENNKKFEAQDTNISKYERVNDSTIKITNCYGTESYLYDLESATPLTRKFSQIKEFKDYGKDKKIAITKDVYSYGDGSNNTFTLTCAIDETGKYRSYLVSDFNTNVYDFSEIGYEKLSKIIVENIQKQIVELANRNQKELVKYII